MASITTLAQVVIWMFWLFLSNFFCRVLFIVYMCTATTQVPMKIDLIFICCRSHKHNSKQCFSFFRAIRLALRLFLSLKSICQKVWLAV